MGLLNSKKETKTLPNYQNETLSSAYDRVIFEALASDEDAYILSLARELLDGNPLVLNFEELNPDPANKIMAFLSGVVFATEGEIVQISKKVFLFARTQEFKDGTLKQFIDEYKE